MLPICPGLLFINMGIWWYGYDVYFSERYSCFFAAPLDSERALPLEPRRVGLCPPVLWRLPLTSRDTPPSGLLRHASEAGRCGTKRVQNVDLANKLVAKGFTEPNGALIVQPAAGLTVEPASAAA